MLKVKLTLTWLENSNPPTRWHSCFSLYFLYWDTLSYIIANSSTHIDKAISLHVALSSHQYTVMNKTSLSPENTNVSQNMLAKQAKFRLKTGNTQLRLCQIL